MAFKNSPSGDGKGSAAVDGNNNMIGISVRSSMVLDIVEDDNVLFKDFTEPDLMKTGYLIPL
jgi:hypothetical protein